ncbi:hypothetical protein O181_078730 [Austropuccinia psidii MF-1]|uniref:Uncharacterized protein n=1 Tax=Austropuccinia psidii MF-1 TaxID=1389203 RepID=A0A9Q3FK62_9BASI|nr:hypothetical protein [Austropuccinia psidii MF-1]
MPQTPGNPTESNEQRPSPPGSESEISDMVSSHELGIGVESQSHENNQDPPVLPELDHNDNECPPTETSPVLNETIHDETFSASPKDIQAFEEREEVKDNKMGQEDITAIIPEPDPKGSAFANF